MRGGAAQRLAAWRPRRQSGQGLAAWVSSVWPALFPLNPHPTHTHTHTTATTTITATTSTTTTHTQEPLLPPGALTPAWLPPS